MSAASQAQHVKLQERNNGPGWIYILLLYMPINVLGKHTKNHLSLPQTFSPLKKGSWRFETGLNLWRSKDTGIHHLEQTKRHWHHSFVLLLWARTQREGLQTVNEALTLDHEECNTRGFLLAQNAAMCSLRT